MAFDLILNKKWKCNLANWKVSLILRKFTVYWVMQALDFNRFFLISILCFLFEELILLLFTSFGKIDLFPSILFLYLCLNYIWHFHSLSR